MLHEIIEELDDLHNRIQIKFTQINTMKTLSSHNPSQFIQDTGHLNGLEDAVEDIAMSRYAIEELITRFLAESMDGQYSAKMGLLEDEVNLYKNKLHIQEKELKKFKKIQKDSVTHDKNKDNN